MDTSLIALVQAPCWGVNAPPLALASLAAYLRARGFSVKAFDLNHEFFLHCAPEYKKYWSGTEDVFWHNDSRVRDFFSAHEALVRGWVERICAGNTAIVGFSVFDTSMFSSLMLAKMIKAARTDVRTVFGGPHASGAMWRDFILSHEFVDAVVEGEGEESLREFAESVIREKTLRGIPGMKVKVDGHVVDAGARALIPHLDSLPTPDFSDFAVGSYERSDTLPAFSSRGCVNRCAFCNEWPYWQRYRFRSGARMFEDVRLQLQRYGETITFFEFYDSLVNGNIKELSLFAQLIIDAGLRIRWAGQAAFRHGMDYAHLQLLKRSGCQCLAFGFESASQRVVDSIGKHFLVSDAERIIREASALKLDVVLNFMFGIPTETEQDFCETLDFVRRNSAYIHTVNPSPSFCAIAPGTYIYDHPGEFNIAAPLDNPFYWRTRAGENTFLIRMQRFERFCKLIRELGIRSTYPFTEYAYRNRALADFYYYERQFDRALQHYLDSEKSEGSDENLRLRIEDCRARATLLRQPSH
jgi:radical SAM superfamily enzyme YgiQ (UPF0313 family)